MQTVLVSVMGKGNIIDDILYNTFYQSKNQRPQILLASVFLCFYPVSLNTYSTYKFWVFGKKH